jgi:hypothetical protein
VKEYANGGGTVSYIVTPLITSLFLLTNSMGLMIRLLHPYETIASVFLGSVVIV